MTFWHRYKPFILQVLLALAVGGLSALVSGGQTLYAGLVAPPLSPPGGAPPAVWTRLYILMGIAAGLLQTSGDTDAPAALALYYLQLGINFLWSPLFFGLGWLLVAAVWLGVLVAAVYLTWRRFVAISPAAGWLLVPYLLWCAFALYLNVGFVVLNGVAV